MLAAIVIAAFFGFALGWSLGKAIRIGRIDNNHRDEDQS